MYIQSLRTIIDRRRPRRRQVVLPFICPADHIFRLNEWVGASIGFREYSFLRHPRLQFSAAWQSATPARVRLCGARPDLPACPALPPTSTSSGPALVPVGSTDGELKRHLEPLAHTKVSAAESSGDAWLTRSTAVATRPAGYLTKRRLLHALTLVGSLGGAQLLVIVDHGGEMFRGFDSLEVRVLPCGRSQRRRRSPSVFWVTVLCVGASAGH